MSNQIYTVDNLINSLKLRGLPPSSQNTFTSAEFAQILSEELQTNIVPVLDSVSEEYFVANYDVAYSSSTSVYAIPPRAVGGKLRDVVFVDSSGNEVLIPRLRPEDLKARTTFIRYQPSPWGYYLRDNSVVLSLGTATGAAAYPTLRMKYIRRPGILTLSTAGKAGQVSNIAGSVVTISYADPSWTTATTFDAISNVPNFVSKGDDLAISNIAGFDLTFSSVPSTLAVGDWIAESMYSPIPQIPVEGHFLLAQYGVCKVLEAFNDPGLPNAYAKAEAMKKQFLEIITPRTEGSPIKLVSRGGIDSWCDNSGWF